MSQPNRKRYRMSTLRQQHAERMGGDVIEIETDSGDIFEVAAPGFWPDEAKKLAVKNDDVGAARILVHDYDAFVAAGGRADDVMLAVKAFAEEQGATLGESSASSS